MADTGSVWNKPPPRLEIKPKEKWFSTHWVRLTVRHSTGKESVNQQHVRSSQSELRGIIAWPSSSTVVVAYGKSTSASVVCDWSTSTAHQDSGIRAWLVENSTGDRHRNDTRSCQKIEDGELWELLVHLLLACKARLFWYWSLI